MTVFRVCAPKDNITKIVQKIIKKIHLCVYTVIQPPLPTPQEEKYSHGPLPAAAALLARVLRARPVTFV